MINLCVVGLEGLTCTIKPDSGQWQGTSQRRVHRKSAPGTYDLSYREFLTESSDGNEIGESGTYSLGEGNIKKPELRDRSEL